MNDRLHKRILRLCSAAAAACVLACALSAPSPAGADSLTDRYNELQKQQQALQSQLSSQNSKLQTDAAKKAAYESSVGVIMQQTSILNQQIAALNAKIDAGSKAIAASQAEIDKTYSLYKQQVRAMYESGDASYIKVLLSSDSFTDFLQRAEILKVLSDKNNDTIAKLNQQKQKLTDEQNALKASQTSLESSRAALAAKQAEVSAQIAAQAAIVAKDTDEANLTKAQRSKIDSELNSLAIQIASQSTGTGDASGIAGYAMQYNGCRYVFGTAGPRTFDCSGFTQWVYEHTVNIALPHSSEDQSNGYTLDANGNYVRRGTKITSQSALRAGDLVFFYNDGYGAGHVGIYIGGGQMIAADNSRVGVRVTSLSMWGSSYMYGWRFVG